MKRREYVTSRRRKNFFLSLINKFLGKKKFVSLSRVYSRARHTLVLIFQFQLCAHQRQYDISKRGKHLSKNLDNERYLLAERGRN